MTGRPRSPEATSVPEDWSPPQDSSPDSSLYDPANPMGVLSVVEGVVRDAIQSVPSKYFEMTERELRRVVNPDETLCRLRLAFWDLFDRTVEKGSGKITVTALVKGVANREFFYKVVLADPKKVSWIATPPLDHLLQAREILEIANRRIRQMVKASWMETTTRRMKDGTTIVTKRANPAVMSQIINAWKTLNDRVHGSVVQKVALAQKSEVSVSVTGDPYASPSLTEIERLEAQIKQAALPAAPIVDGEVSE